MINLYLIYLFILKFYTIKNIEFKDFLVFYNEELSIWKIKNTQNETGSTYISFSEGNFL